MERHRTIAASPVRSAAGRVESGDDACDRYAGAEPEDSGGGAQTSNWRCWTVLVRRSSPAATLSRRVWCFATSACI